MFQVRGVRWCSSRASDSESRGPAFDPLYSIAQYSLIAGKQWLRLDMTEKMLIETLNLNTNKHMFKARKERTEMYNYM